MLLPALNLPAIVMVGENQISLYPRNSGSGIDQQVGNSLRIDAAILAQFFPAFFRDGFNPAFHRDAVSASEQVERFFRPQVDSGLESDLQWPFGNPFQQTADVLAHPENLI